MQQLLQQLEAEAIAIWEFLTGGPSQPTQLERLYLKPLVYLVAFFLNQQKAIAATAKPGIMGGSATAYRDRVLQISADIADAGITNPSGNNLTIHLLAKSGAPSITLLNLVQNTMQADPNRMVCDTISVQPATAQNYTIAVTIFLIQTASENDTITKVTDILNTYKATKGSVLGADIIRTDIIDLIRNLTEVGDVQVAEPATNLIVPPQSYANCTSVTVAVGGRMG